MSDEDPELDPLFVALTRFPIFAGVPFLYFGVLLILGAVLFLIPGLKFTQMIAIEAMILMPAYGLGYVLTNKDIFWMQILLTKFNKCSPTMNKRHWKRDSFMP